MCVSAILMNSPRKFDCDYDMERSPLASMATSMNKSKWKWKAAFLVHWRWFRGHFLVVAVVFCWADRLVKETGRTLRTSAFVRLSGIIKQECPSFGGRWFVGRLAKELSKVI